MDSLRCAARRDITTTAELCPQRADCERHHQFTLHGPGADPAPLWLCTSEDFESRIPRPCAGRTMRLSPRTHPLCRNCRRLQYAEQDGITPDFIDSDGTATCADRLVHGQGSVGDGGQSASRPRGMSENTVRPT